MAIVTVRKQQGRIKAVLEANREWLQMMKPSQRNLLLRDAAIKSVYDWRYTKLRDRFELSVKQGPYNFQGKSASPLVNTGEMRNNALNKGKPVARAKTDATGTQQLNVTYAVDYGHFVNKEVARVMRIMPSSDNQFAADRFAFHVAQAKVGLFVPKRSNAKHKFQLTKRQRGRFGDTVRKASSIRLRAARSKP